MHLLTVPIDVPTNVLLGALVALAATRRLRREDAPALGGGVTRAAALLSAWFAACVTYFYLRHGDWMYCYFVDARTIPLWAGLPLFWFGLVGAGVVGAVAAQAFIREGRTLGAIGVAAYGLVGWLGIFALTWDRYFHVGRTAEYAAGTAPRLADVAPFQTAMNVSGALIGAGVVAALGWAFLGGRGKELGSSKRPGASE